MGLRRIIAVAAAASCLSAAAWSQANAAKMLSLQDSIDRALSAGIDARLQDLDLEIKRSQTDQAVAANRLKLQAIGGYQHNNGQFGSVTPRAGFTQSTTTSSESESVSAGVKVTAPITSLSLTGEHSIRDADQAQLTTASASVDQTLWDGILGGRYRLSDQVSALQLNQNVLAAGADRDTLVSQVKQAYYTLAQAQETLALDRQIIAQRELELEQTKSLFDSGRGTLLELSQAQLNLDSARIDLTDAENNLSASREALSQLMGLPVDSQYTVQTPDEPPLQTDPLSALIQKALDGRQDLQQLRLSKRIAEINVNIARVAASAVVSASASVDYAHDWTNDLTGASWNAGLQVTVPVVDAGVSLAQERQGRLQVETAGLQVQQLVRSIAQEVTQNYESVRSLARRLDIARRNVDLAAKKLELKRTQFQQGLASQLDVLSAGVDESTAQSSLQQARTDLGLAVLKLQGSTAQR